MNNNEITKTIIKGLKKITRKELVCLPSGEPKIVDKDFIIESDGNIDEMDINLIIRSEYNLNLGYIKNSKPHSYLRVSIDGELKSCKVLKEEVRENVKYIIVSHILEEKEQNYNYIMLETKYKKRYDDYFNEFIKQFENDQEKMELINSFLETTPKEKIVALIKSGFRNNYNRDIRIKECEYTICN